MDSDLDVFTVKQLKKESELISSFKFCHLKRDFLDISKIKADLIKQNLDVEFYNADFLATLFCVFDTITYIPYDNDEAFNEASRYLHSLFTNLRRIGAESENGNALMVGIRSVQDVLIWKTPKVRSHDELFHEYFVGVAGTNPLRKLCPNYSYILGAFKCMLPEIGEDKKVVSWCEANQLSKDNLINYVFYEKVSGVAVEEKVNTCSADEFFSWFVQLCIAIHIGKHIQFTHYDLHNGNVLVRPWGDEKEFAIPYEVTPGLIWYVRTSLVAQMIDYGMSHISINGEHFGKYGLESWGVLPDTYRPMYDVYKFLGFSLNQMNGTNSAVRELLPIWRILRRDLFGEDNLGPDAEVLRQISDDYESLYALPEQPLEAENSYMIWDFLQTLKTDKMTMKLWNKVVSTSQPNVTLMSCGDYCPTPGQIEAQIGGTPHQKVKRSLDTIRRETDRKMRTSAMSSLPSQIVELRKQMSTLYVKLRDEMKSQDRKALIAIPNVVTTGQFQDFINTHVEPNMNIKERLIGFESMKSTLQDYYKMKGTDVDLAEYDFGDVQAKWVQTLNSVRAKLNNLIVPAKAQVMQDKVIGLMA